MKKDTRSLSILTAMRRTFPLIAKQAPMALTAHIFLLVLTGFLSGIMTPATERVFNSLADAVLGDGTARTVYFALLLKGGILVSRVLIGSIHGNLLGQYMYTRMDGALSFIAHEKFARLPAQLFEDKEMLDNMEKSRNGMNSAIQMLFTFTQMLFSTGVYFVVMGIYLWQMQPVLLAALSLVFIPVALSQIIQARIKAQQQDYLAPLKRVEGRYNKHAKNETETRIFGVFNHFNALQLSARRLIFAKEWEVRKKVQLIEFGLNLTKVAGWVGIVLLLYRGLMAGNVTVGAFAAVFAAIGTMFSQFESIFSQIQQSASNQLGAIHHFIDFLDLPESTEGDGTPPDFNQGGIVASSITFRYPAAEKAAVDGVSLTIRKGETIAIVGENGSGKTTLVKLLCGLYKPDEGNVTIGGRDTVKTSDTSLFSATTAVFQNFNNYKPLNLGDNVRVSNLKNSADIESALKAAEVDYTDEATFPKGLESLMGREFDGTEISKGQWQRIAMARGMYREHEIIILDEPTAAIDPLEETRVYNRFAEYAKDKTAILVTHRLGSARIADRIIVMDGGKIVESGKHEDLLAKGGKYAEMWMAQAEWYNYGI